MERDLVHGIHRQWQDARPDLDVSPVLVVGRLLRAAALLQRARDVTLAEHGITRAEFDVLAALRRAGPLTPGALSREMLSSGAATTKRLEQLRGRGLITREPSERDRRVAYLRLTEAGGELIDRVFPANLEREHAAVAGLGPQRREQLADLLGELLVDLEGSTAAR